MLGAQVLDAAQGYLNLPRWKCLRIVIMMTAWCTKRETSCTRRRLLITTKQTVKDVRLYWILLAYLLEKDVLIKTEDSFCPKHLSSFLEILTRGNILTDEGSLIFKYSNGGLINFILYHMWWTAPSPKLQQKFMQKHRRKPV